MASIIQQPDALSFLKTLKAYRISSSSLVTFKLTKGSDVLVEETYAPDADGIVTIDVQDVTSQFLSIHLPDSDVYPQTGASAQFTAYVNNASVGTFRVVSGGVRKLSDTVSNWLKANWMTWQPQTKSVRWHQPEYLTYYHVVASVVKAKFYPRTGAAITVTVHTAAAGEYNTYNTELAHLFSLSGRDADQLNGLVDVWVENTSGTRLSYVQRYVYAPDTRSEHYYFCENSVGGLDTFCFTGARTLAPEVEHESAAVDGRTLSITDGQERKWNQNTGVVGKTDSVWLWDFFSSLHQWAIIDDNLECIVLDSSGLGFSDSENVGAYDFSFRLSDGGPLRKIVRSQDDLPLIEVPSPAGDLFFLAPRVIDYPDANLDDNLLVLVQSPFVQEWQKTSLGGLKQWVIDAIPGIGGSNVAWGTESGGTIPLTVDGVQKSLVTNVVSALGYTPANQASLSGYLTTSAAASTYQTKITSSNKIAYANISGTPASLPASDVYDWAKASSKPSYAFSELTSHPVTISGYGITNAYTKTETDTAISEAVSASESAIHTWVENRRYLAESDFYALFEVVKTGGVITSIKAKYDFWSVAEISANGLSTGGSGGSNVYWGTESGGTIPLTVDGVQKSLITNVISALGYTPANQAALSSYLTTSAAASTYQTKITSSNKLDWGCISSPTTISGYGITNAYTKTETDTAIITALASYLPLSGGTMSGEIKFGDDATWLRQTNGNNSVLGFVVSSTGFTGVTSGLYLGAAGCNLTLRATSDISIYRNSHSYTNIDTGNIGSQSVSYAASAGAVAWISVSGRPTNLSQFTDDVVRGHYLPLAGGTITGNLGIGATSPTTKLDVVGAISIHRTDHTSVDTSLTMVAGDNLVNFVAKDLDDHGCRMTFTCETTDVMTLLSSGNVGIGTTSPASKLHVNGFITSPRNQVYEGTQFLSGSSYNSRSLSSVGWYRIATTSGTAASANVMRIWIKRTYNNSFTEAYILDLSIGFSTSSASYENGIQITQVSGNYGTQRIPKIRVVYNRSSTSGVVSYVDLYYNHTSANTVSVWVDGYASFNQLVAVTDTPTSVYEFTLTKGMHATQNIFADGESTAGILSDRRFKDNVRDFEDAMGIIRQLRPVTFDWNGLATSYCAWHKGSDFGLIAQEVAPVLPSVISPIYQHYMRVDYSKLSALCIAGLLEHDSEIEILKKRVEELENILRNYES